MNKRIDISGMRFGNLTAVSFSHTENKHTFWTFVCDCGKSIVAMKSNAIRKDRKSISCGCNNKKRMKENNPLATHLKSGNDQYKKTYCSWKKMRDRCYVKTESSYKYYGGKGVSVCERWINSFQNFLDDMGERPEGKTLDRIDPYGNYEKANCRWASNKEQANNKR